MLRGGRWVRGRGGNGDHFQGAGGGNGDGGDGTGAHGIDWWSSESEHGLVLARQCPCLPRHHEGAQHACHSDSTLPWEHYCSVRATSLSHHWSTMPPPTPRLAEPAYVRHHTANSRVTGKLEVPRPSGSCAASTGTELATGHDAPSLSPCREQTQCCNVLLPLQCTADHDRLRMPARADFGYRSLMAIIAWLAGRQAGM